VKKRHVVLSLLCIVSGITFLDRLAIAVAEPGIRSDLNLSPSQWGWVLSAYVLANALFEIPSGARGDLNGQRSELTRIAIWWSAFTVLTGACRNLWQIGASRFLFGVGAAGAYPNAAGVIARWFPRDEHARAQGFIWGAGRLGGGIAPLLLVPLQRIIGWRGMFVVLGVMGVVWAVLWVTWFRNTPQQMKGVSAEELSELATVNPAVAQPTPWRKLFALPQLWLITLAYFCYAWGSWFYFGWFTTWLVRGAGFSVSRMGLVASFPFFMGFIGNLLGGAVVEPLARRYGRRVAYRSVACGCLVVTACLLASMSMASSSTTIIWLATLGLGVMDLMLPSAWAMCIRLGGEFGGTATGMMNTGGNLGGWLGAIVFGYIAQMTGSYNTPLLLIAGIVLVGAILFSQVDCTKGLDAAVENLAVN
jgi:MFS transporter, ACS family, glucarate transporter